MAVYSLNQRGSMKTGMHLRLFTPFPALNVFVMTRVQFAIHYKVATKHVTNNTISITRLSSTPIMLEMQSLFIGEFPFNPSG